MSELDRYTVVLKADTFQQAAFQDRFPIQYADCERVEAVTQQAIDSEGFYTVGTMVNGMGYVITAYNKKEMIIANFVVNYPVEAEDRKIPQMSWLRHKFKSIGHDFKSNTIRQTHKIVENHLRDGGTWEFSQTSDSLHFELKYKGFIKSKLSFYRENIFV